MNLIVPRALPSVSNTVYDGVPSTTKQLSSTSSLLATLASKQKKCSLRPTLQKTAASMLLAARADRLIKRH